MKNPTRIMWTVFALVSLLFLFSCSRPTSPVDPHAFPQAVDRVATDITLSIYSDGWGTLLETRELAVEGPVTIEIEEQNPFSDPPRYYIYAAADSFYTELYRCQKGETITIDLDGVPQQTNAMTGVIFAVREFFADRYYAGRTVELTGSEGISETITTDQQGRYGIRHVPTGIYTLSFTYWDTVFSFEITNARGTNYEELSFCEPVEVYAPNIYLYPETEMDVTVELGFPSGGHLIESEPPYGEGWHVRVNPEGIINGHYEYLFYEALLFTPVKHESGWLLNGDDLEGELRGLLERLGFVGREVDDFVDYWLPLLEGWPWYAIYPQEVESMITLHISPAPGSILRALFLIRPLEHPLSIPPPSIPGHFVRDGFTAVEWGVIGWSH